MGVDPRPGSTFLSAHGPCPSPSHQAPPPHPCPTRELREKLKPELMGLIRQQRLLRLCEGTLFRKISSRRRQGG